MLHKSQVLFYVLLALVAGVAVASFAAVSLSAILVLIILGLLILTVTGYHRTFGQTTKGIQKRQIGLLIGFLIIIFALGIYRFNYFQLTHSYLLDFADHKVGKSGHEKDVTVKLHGYVDGEFTVSGSRAHFPFRVKEIIVGTKILPISEKILVNTGSWPQYEYGDELLLNGAIKTPQNIDTFDYVAYLKKDDIRTVISSPEIETAQLKLSFFEKLKIRIKHAIFDIKDKFQLAINKSLPEPTASYLNGVLLGARQNIPDDLKESFNRTSTSHILAISGYNIAIIADAILWFLVFWVPRRVAFWISTLAIILFTILTGASASVVRAAVMGLLFLGASSYGRLYDPRNSIILAGTAMVWLHPLILRFDIGFQLSFLAVMGLLYLNPILENIGRKLPDPSGIKRMLFASISAQVFVLPLLIYYFKTLSLVSLPVNLLVLPFVPTTMLLGFLAGLTGMIFLPLGKLIGIFAWAIATYQIKIVEFFGSLPFAAIKF